MKNRVIEKKGKKESRATGGTEQQREPLTNEEFHYLRQLISDAENVNIRLTEAAQELQAARNCLVAAEGEYREARGEAAEIHTKIAPLTHRLPTV